MVKKVNLHTNWSDTEKVPDRSVRAFKRNLKYSDHRFKPIFIGRGRNMRQFLREYDFYIKEEYYFQDVRITPDLKRAFYLVRVMLSKGSYVLWFATPKTIGPAKFVLTSEYGEPEPLVMWAINNILKKN